jgi:thiamine biosynthesis lipoprotein
MIYRIDFRAMGCRMLAMLESSLPEAADLLAQVPNWFEEWEQSLSRFREESELNHLNRSAGWPVQVSQTLWDVFEAALEAERTSNGLVTAGVLEALVKAGYDRSFELLPREIELAPVSIWNKVSSLQEVSTQPTSRTICLPADMRLDFGGVAKGWAAEQAAQRLAEFGPALVSAGGDIAISAGLSDTGLWPVTIDDPFNPGQIIATLGLGACGIASSGTDYRRWKQGGRWNHHIIDPRSGQPAQTDLIATSVIAPTTTQAEMAAKTALILGSQDGLKWIETRPELSALLVLETGDVISSSNLEPLFWRTTA